MFCRVMANELPQPAPSTDVPPFPHHAALAPTSIEAAERLNADPSAATPTWHPEDGDFS
jgi:hypothetical protein